MVKMKRSAAKCMRVDTPELELPMFDNTFRFANAMARSPRRGQGSGFKNIMETTCEEDTGEATARGDCAGAPWAGGELRP